MNAIQFASVAGLSTLPALRESSATLAADLSQCGVVGAGAHAVLLIYATWALLLEHMGREARNLTVSPSSAQADLSVLVQVPTFTLVQPVLPIARDIALEDGLPTPTFVDWSQSHRGVPDLAVMRLNAQATPHIQTRAVALLALTYAQDCAEGQLPSCALHHAQDVAWRATGTLLEPRWTYLEPTRRPA